ncbi:MAG: Nif3-like dinuclear metal center hexameric protein [Cyclobacteriaceae bacterium]
MKVKDIAKTLQQWAPIAYQESYDNSGLLVGSMDTEIESISITLDVTEAVIDEAISTGANLIVAHHPLIFKGIKSLTGNHWVERCIIKAIKHDIAIYAIHTNLDNVNSGVNHKITELIGLEHVSILSPKKSTLTKLVTFVPKKDAEKVRKSLFEAGAGEIGKYDHCSFTTEGTGSFRPGNEANPAVGVVHKDEQVNEDRIEVIFPNHLSSQVISGLQNAHPYEEVAYFLTDLKNINQEVGAGMIGQLPKPMSTELFLNKLKKDMGLNVIKHTKLCKPSIKSVAVCGGSGSFLLSTARAKGADIFITGDFKHHEFFEADEQIIITDIGHYESEVFTKDLIYDFLREKFANIALRLSEVNTNPINYL